ncbi:MAG: DNA-formamidopyrimidine glycosylase, partial [Kofleriaceae bacterium]|nr:DNA-formamidopyrimidine glycosylase [Kofleriaceae bacterium]
MPELPEVETVRRSLAPIVGAKIVGVWDSGKGLHMQRKPPRAKLKKLVGATITEV